MRTVNRFVLPNIPRCLRFLIIRPVDRKTAIPVVRKIDCVDSSAIWEVVFVCELIDRRRFAFYEGGKERGRRGIVQDCIENRLVRIVLGRSAKNEVGRFEARVDQVPVRVECSQVARDGSGDLVGFERERGCLCGRNWFVRVGRVVDVSETDLCLRDLVRI